MIETRCVGVALKGLMVTCLGAFRYVLVNFRELQLPELTYCREVPCPSFFAHRRFRDQFECIFATIGARGGCTILGIRALGWVIIVRACRKDFLHKICRRRPVPYKGPNHLELQSRQAPIDARRRRNEAYFLVSEKISLSNDIPCSQQ